MSQAAYDTLKKYARHQPNETFFKKPARKAGAPKERRRFAIESSYADQGGEGSAESTIVV